MTNPASISTLSEFLLQAQTQYMVFDMGRGIRKIDNQTFFEWENQQTPCRYPRLNHAWFCIVFWNEKLNTEHYIWFVKIPLDENGLMMSAALNQFLDIVVQALGKELQHTQNKQAQLPDNPFVFTPSQQQLADCNAHIRDELVSETRDNSKTTAYLKAPNLQANEQEWASLSVQNIADFVVQDCKPSHLREDSSTSHKSGQAMLAENINLYSQPVLTCLFASLESMEVKPPLVDALIDFHRTRPEPNMAALCLRAMSFKPHSLCIEYIHQLINGDNKLEGESALPQIQMETCVVIAGRYWPLLNEPTLLGNFMHQVALLDPSFDLFLGLYGDLVKVPELRATMLAFLRSTQRSNEVSKAIGVLFSK